MIAVRALLVLAAAVAAIILGVVALVAHPVDPTGLLAGAAIAAGAGLVFSVDR